MANRTFKRPRYAFEQDTVDVFGRIPIGATGAVGAVKGGPITSVTRTGTGAYSIQLPDNYTKLLGFDATFVGTTASGVGGVEVASTTPDADIATGLIKIQCFSSGTTAADPANGTSLYFVATLRNSSIGPWD